MSLRVQAESDLAITLEDGATGFGWPIVLTDPSGTISTGLFGQSGDISQVIDPETGQAVSGRLAHVAIRNASVLAQFPSLPKAIEDKAVKPWLVAFDDLATNTITFRVVESNPDRTLGLTVLQLEVWQS